jgi:hypothetical protein
VYDGYINRLGNEDIMSAPYNEQEDMENYRQWLDLMDYYAEYEDEDFKNMERPFESEDF